MLYQAGKLKDAEECARGFKVSSSARPLTRHLAINCLVSGPEQSRPTGEDDHPSDAIWWYEDPELVRFRMRWTEFLAGRVVLDQPIELTVSRYQDGYLVTDALVDRHGFGVTLIEALAEYEDVLQEYFQHLSDNASQLSPHLNRHLSILTSLLTEQSAP